MPLITCSECGKEISDKAKVCPHCGNPVVPIMELQQATPPKEKSNVAKNKHASRAIVFSLMSWVAFLGLGLLTLIAVAVTGIENAALVYIPVVATVVCALATIYQCVRAVRLCKNGAKGIIRIIISALLIVFPIYFCFTTVSPLLSQNETESTGISQELSQMLYEDNAQAFSDYLEGNRVDEIEAFKGIVCYNASNCLNALIDSGANIPNELDGKSILQYSIDRNSEAGVNYAMKALGQSADAAMLRQAVKELKTASAYAMIKNGVDPTGVDSEGYTLLHELAVGGRASYATAFRVKNKAQKENNLLNLNSCEELFKYDNLFVDSVVEAGVDVNAETIYGRTAVDFIFGKEKAPESYESPEDYDGTTGGASNLLYSLMKNGADVNLTYALNMAVSGVDPDLLTVICERGYDINQLEAAQIIGSFYQTDMYYFLPKLKELGFDFTAMNGAILLRNLCCNAVISENSEAAGLWTGEDYISAINFVLDSGANANWQSKDGESTMYRVLFAALACDDVEYAMSIMRMLVDAGAEINPMQNGKYMMAEFETYNSLPMIKAYKEEFGLH